MKIKLQDYSLISNEWIDERIAEIKRASIHVFGEVNLTAEMIIVNLELVKKQTIPSEKLADVEDKQGFPLYTNFGTKQEFITSEIEIL
jgi:hypothetical protein